MSLGASLIGDLAHGLDKQLPRLGRVLRGTRVDLSSFRRLPRCDVQARWSVG
jgi:hypothetical protein